MKKTICVLLLSLFAFIACSKDSEMQQEQTVEANLRGTTPKIQVCHFAKSDNIYEVISVSGKTLENHLKHGDVVLDADGDGYAVYNECGYLNENGIDCDDANAAINPDATEVCDGIDNNCDGIIDEGVTTTFYADTDVDGFGNTSVTMEACSAPAGYVLDNTDCDDTDAAINPGATEICDNSIDDNCDGNTDEGCVSLSIGDTYQGGKIAYILQSGDPGYVAGETHGIIAATSDQSTGIQWYNGDFIVTGATDTALGTGLSNTNTIVTAQGAGSYAAQLCADLVLNNYSDWYLPSKDELNKLYINRGAIGGFASDYYWSSSENEVFNAWLQHFLFGFQANGGKNDAFWVRAVRAF